MSIVRGGGGLRVSAAGRSPEEMRLPLAHPLLGGEPPVLLVGLGGQQPWP